VQRIESNLIALNRRLAAACTAAGRDTSSVTLIGVSKTKPVDAVRTAAELGVRQLGENYLDEALEKIAATTDLNLTWHYIGRIQSNKTRQIAEHFDWVHCVDRAKIANRLNSQCPPGKTLNVLIQINIDDDPAKAGVAPSDAAQLLLPMLSLPNLAVRGLMTMLAKDLDARASYQSMAQLFESLGHQLNQEQLGAWDTLSMGMTADLEHAIAAGATHVRIGTALFGERVGSTKAAQDR
jgi:pyridoxal phosphate enzyme (YggS family)